MRACVCERETERYNEKQRNIHRDTFTLIQSQRDKETVTERQRHSHRETEIQSNRDRDRER